MPWWVYSVLGLLGGISFLCPDRPKGYAKKWAKLHEYVESQSDVLSFWVKEKMYQLEEEE